MKVTQLGFIEDDGIETPASGQVVIYAKSDKSVYQKDDTGTETQLSGGGGSTTAEALGTSGADVNVGSAAPPTTGDVLTATSATTATWQAPSGSSSGATFSVKLTSDQVLPSSSAIYQIEFDDIQWDTASIYDDTTYTIEPNVLGYYLLTFNIVVSNHDISDRVLVYVNGAAVRQFRNPGNATVTGNFTGSVIVPVSDLAFGDITIQYFAASALGTIIISGTTNSYIQGYFLRGL
jgi:hypothetical protein